MVEESQPEQEEQDQPSTNESMVEETKEEESKEEDNQEDDEPSSKEEPKEDEEHNQEEDDDEPSSKEEEEHNQEEEPVKAETTKKRSKKTAKKKEPVEKINYPETKRKLTLKIYQKLESEEGWNQTFTIEMIPEVWHNLKLSKHFLIIHDHVNQKVIRRVKNPYTIDELIDLMRGKCGEIFAVHRSQNKQTKIEFITFENLEDQENVLQEKSIELEVLSNTTEFTNKTSRLSCFIPSLYNQIPYHTCSFPPLETKKVEEEEKQPESEQQPSV